MPADGLETNRRDVTIAIVSLNTRELLAACLRSVMATTRVSFDVHVVDNGSSDGSTSMVAVQFPEVRLTKNGSNRGFAAANNCAIREADSRYVLLLNPDTLVSPETVGDLIAFMDDHPDVGIDWLNLARISDKVGDERLALERINNAKPLGDFT